MFWPIAITTATLDLLALNHLHETPLSRKGRNRWSAAILALPILGALLWLRRGARRRVPAPALRRRHR